MSQTKSVIRKALVDKIKLLDQNYIDQKSLMITRNIMDIFSKNINVKVCCLYLSQSRREVNTKFLLRNLLKQGTLCLIPKLINNSGEMEMTKISCLNEPLQLNGFGIWETVSNESFTCLDRVDAVVVPGVGFSLNTGNRLGRGKAYYDKFINHILRLNNSCQIIGLALNEQIADFPCDQWDEPMDIIICPDKVYKIKRKQCE
ncbi:hypothetical protein GJ496_009330 [Pomphorhynchus laevis]|nr:hypothetical protein GJ496_009330 [Pomphorhynchus laevis]